jgi:malate synthase
MSETLIQTQTQEQAEIQQPYIFEKCTWLLTPEFILLLEKLHQCLTAEHKAIVQYGNQLAQALQKDFEPVLKQIKDDCIIEPFICNPLPQWMQGLKTQIVCPINQTSQLVKLINNNERYQKPDVILLDFAHTLKPTWSGIIEGIKNAVEIAGGDVKYTQQGFATFHADSIKNDLPLIVYKPRTWHQFESNIGFDENKLPALIFDVAALVYHVSIHSKRKSMVLEITLQNAYEAQWINEMLYLLENVMDYEENTIKVVANINSVSGIIHIHAITEQIQQRLVGFAADFKGKIFDDLKLLRKSSNNIVTERKNINHTTVGLQALSAAVCKAAMHYNLIAFAGLSVNAAGKFVDYKDVDVAHYENELAQIFSVGFDVVTISHQGYIAFVMQQQKGQALQQNDLLCTHDNKISEKGLRDNIRMAITYMQAWNQGLGYAIFDNRWEDLQTFEIVRAQIYQWVRNSVHLSVSNERINSRMITTIILEEVEKLKDEIAEEFAGNPISEIQTISNTYTQAALEVEQLFLQDELAPFFN